MSLHLGRLVLPEPNSWKADAQNVIVVSGSYRAGSIADGMFRRDQILALPGDLDIPVIPITLDGEHRMDGYYKALAARCSTDKMSRQQGHIYDYEVDLAPVATHSKPVFESIMLGALLTNANGGTTADMLGEHAVPFNTTEYIWTTGANLPTFYTRGTADGDLLYMLASSAAVQLQQTARYGVAPVDFYIGSARIEQGQTLGSSTLLPLVGRNQTLDDTVNFRLQNGLVRVTQSNSDLLFSWWNGSTWSTPKDIQIFDYINGAYPNPLTSITVLRNAVEEVVIRLGSGTGFVSAGPLTIDLSLRRGSKIVRAYTTFPASTTAKWEIAPLTAEAATSLTPIGTIGGGAIRATANDSSSNRFIEIMQQGVSTYDLVQGGIKASNASTTSDFGISALVPGTAASVPDDSTTLVKLYMCAQAETMRIVAR